MAYSLNVFFKELELAEGTAAVLTERCSKAGLEEVIDLALVEPAMVPQILGGETGPLGPTLLKAAAWAEKVAEGWARGERNMMGGGPRAWAGSARRQRRGECGCDPDARAGPAGPRGLGGPGRCQSGGGEG